MHKAKAFPTYAKFRRLIRLIRRTALRRRKAEIKQGLGSLYPSARLAIVSLARVGRNSLSRMITGVPLLSKAEVHPTLLKINRARRSPFFTNRMIVCGSELQDQASTSSKADRASPRRIIDQSPASRPKSRGAVIATEAVSVTTPDFLKATGTVFCFPIFLHPRFPDPAMLERTRGYF